MADSIYWRLFSRTQHLPTYRSLFTEARLAAAPDITMTLDPKDHMHGMIAFTGSYERSLTAKLKIRGERGGLLVDVGANWGYFTLLWAAANPGNKVIAIEASPRNITPLRSNVARNHLGHQVVIHDLAVADAPGTIEFDLGSDDETGWGGVAPGKTASTVTIEAATLDQICAGIESIDVLKIDVEGAETLVLKGASELLRAQRIKEVFLEVNKLRMARLGVASDAPLELLQTCGYQCVSDGDEVHALARR
jgi:FkbM family methyltransferase